MNSKESWGLGRLIKAAVAQAREDNGGLCPRCKKRKAVIVHCTKCLAELARKS